jgi:hypothetical protein
MKRSEIALTALLTIIIVTALGAFTLYEFKSRTKKGKWMAWQQTHHCQPLQDGTFQCDTGIVKKPID